jgi:hypothetical protein
MVAKRIGDWKHQDTGADGLPKVVNAQGILRYPAMYIWQNIGQTTTTTSWIDTEFEGMLIASTCICSFVHPYSYGAGPRFRRAIEGAREARSPSVLRRDDRENVAIIAP